MPFLLITACRFHHLPLAPSFPAFLGEIEKTGSGTGSGIETDGQVMMTAIVIRGSMNIIEGTVEDIGHDLMIGMGGLARDGGRHLGLYDRKYCFPV